jgi:putative oxidoreductase
MKRILIPEMNLLTSSSRVSTGLLILRVLAGTGFVFHGSGKIVQAFSWMPPEAPVPAVFQGLAAVAEFGGGIAWVLGLLTPLASLGILCTMTVAASFHLSRGDGFVGGYEMALLYWVIAMLLLLAGPGRFSLDAKIASKCGGK